VEFLGVTADIYRELEDTKRSTELYARESRLARKYYGMADEHAIDGLLGQADNAVVDGDGTAALKLLEQADPLIRVARLDYSVARARWWKIRGEALFDRPGEVGNVQAALAAAAALFDRVAPANSMYPQVLVDLGSLALDLSQFAPSAAYYRRAVAVATANEQSEGVLLLANAGLALALKDLADFNGAAAAFASGTNVALRTYGRESRSYWIIASDWAKYRYERGDRQAALQAFDQLVRNLPAERAGFRNGYEALEAAQVLRKYGHCLAVDGQGARAIQLLERARDLLRTSASHAPDSAHLLLDLGRAYDSGGRVDQAREAFMAAINTMETRHAPAAQMAGAREQLGRFLLAQGDASSAYPQFVEALHLSTGTRNETAVLAQTGLAAIAISRSDLRTALEASGAAISNLSHIEGYYDVRVEPYVWGVHARALLFSGDAVNARVYASRSRDAIVNYYDPSSAQFREAEVLLQRVAANASLR
jgi:tetratricopeptide (TPR) repeat protein